MSKNFYFRLNIFFIFMISCMFAFSLGSFGYAAFTSNANNSNNIFTAAATFPTITGNPTDTPTVTPTNNPTPTVDTSIANHIVISEIQTATAGATTSDFVELYNPTGSDINLQNYQLVHRAKSSTSNVSLKSFSKQNIIKAHSFFLWSSTDGDYNLQINADVSSSQNIANNGSIALLDNAGNIIDGVAWGSGQAASLGEGTAFANISDGKSYERKAQNTSDSLSMASGSDTTKGNGYDTNNNITDFILRDIPEPQNSNSSMESL